MGAVPCCQAWASAPSGLPVPDGVCTWVQKNWMLGEAMPAGWVQPHVEACLAGVGTGAVASTAFLPLILPGLLFRSRG